MNENQSHKNKYIKVVPYLTSSDPSSLASIDRDVISSWYHSSVHRITWHVANFQDQLSWLVSDDAAHMIAERLVNMYYYGSLSEIGMLFADDPDKCNWVIRDVVVALRTDYPELYRLLDKYDIIFDRQYVDPSYNPVNRDLIDAVTQYVSEHMPTTMLKAAIDQLQLILDDNHVSSSIIGAAYLRDVIASVGELVNDLVGFQYQVSQFYTTIYCDHVESARTTSSSEKYYYYDSQSPLWDLGISFDNIVMAFADCWDGESDSYIAYYVWDVNNNLADDRLSTNYRSALETREELYHSSQLSEDQGEELDILDMYREMCLDCDLNPDNYYPIPDEYDDYDAYHATDDMF